jgi:hypothetical protein
MTGVRTQRLGELPRACSPTDGYPSRLSKIGSRERVPLGIDTAIPAAVRGGTAAGITRRRDHGADGDRTHDLRLAKPALSQLSYSPEGGGAEAASPKRARGQARRASRGRSSLPSHFRLPPGAGSRCSCLDAVLLWFGDFPYSFRPARDQARQPLPPKWAQVESNYRPHPYQGCALAN